MKYPLTLISLLVFSTTLSAQGTCELFLKDGKLSGNCENSYFTHFEMPMNVELLDSTTLFNQLPLKGTLMINHQHEVEVSYDITNRAGFTQILFKTNPGWFTMDSLIIQPNRLSFAIDHDPDVPVTTADLTIIRRTKELLQDEDSWHKKDDRDCEDDVQGNRYSLFCALQRASIEVEGAYNHRNAIMQKIRHTIVDLFPNKEWEHRLKDFNNMPETTFSVLKELLHRVENEVLSELEIKK